MTKRRVSLRSVDELLVHRFVTQHLPTCNCAGPCQRSVNGVRPALAHLLHVLRGEGRISEPQALIPQAIRDEVERFDSHLSAVCGLAQATRISRRMWVGKFLVDRFGHTPIEFDGITSVLRAAIGMMYQPSAWLTILDGLIQMPLAAASSVSFDPRDQPTTRREKTSSTTAR
jgi:integrase/recombinase XerD